MSVEIYLALYFTAGVYALVGLAALGCIALMGVVELGMRAVRRVITTKQENRA